MIIIVNCQSCGNQLFRDQDYKPKGDGLQILVPPCKCAAQQSVHVDVCPACFGDCERLHNDGLMHKCQVCNGTGKRP